MKYIIDASVLLAVGHGDHVKIQMLGWHRKSDVGIPEPVVARTAIEVRGIAKANALSRWTMLVDATPRVAWTTAVTEKLLSLGERSDLDAITAAYAPANDASSNGRARSGGRSVRTRRRGRTS